MNNINYAQLYTKLTKGLSTKTKDIFDRRFGVKTGAEETLESIGKSLGITRERVRQIEEVGFNFVRKNHKETLEKLFSSFVSYFQEQGGLKKEDSAFLDLGGKKNKPYVLFLLRLGNQFSRVAGKKEYHYFWSTMEKPEATVKATLASLVADIEKNRKLLTKDELFTQLAANYNLNNQALASYLEISRKIQENKEGKIGLISWPEIKPRGVKDKAFLVFKDAKRPLHFREITSLIDKLVLNTTDKKTHPQTVHNELIKDQRFVLVGRGMYALSEWGYVPGTIKDIITKVIQEKQGLSQEDIVKQVLAQRLVAKNTVLINLNNKKHFSRDPQGKYFLQETKIA